MPDLSVKYMGLDLPNPVIVSSSDLTSGTAGVKKAVEAGAGAVILKSLFEEDIAASLVNAGSSSISAHPEVDEYIEEMGMLLEPDKYLTVIEESVKEFDVPVIASLNCYSEKWWTEYAGRMEIVGADAIELNLSPIALKDNITAADLEKKIINMVKLARKTVKIPLAIKLGSNFTALPNFAKQLKRAGADSLTLFNRFYNIDVDIDKIELKSGNSLSVKEEFNQVLRWLGILSGLSDLDLTASSGVYSRDEVVKSILAGASAAQICSVIYREGMPVIGKIVNGFSEWMEERNYSSIADFKGKLSLNKGNRNDFYNRLQYVKALQGKKKDK